MDLANQIDPQSSAACNDRKIKSIRSAISAGMLSEEQPLGLFYDLEHFKNSIEEVRKAFPSHFIHTMAIKANPVKALMEFAYQNGLGFEAASFGELTQALRVSDPSRIVFDSPIKTKKELKVSLDRGVYLNLDNLQELQRVEELMASGEYKTANIGLRINPQVGLGTIKEMSTSGAVSKFGIAYFDYKDKIFDAYKRNSFLNGIHIHVGSQGCPLDLMLKGIRAVLDIAVEIDKQAGFQQIKFIDIGGGLPVNFDSEEEHTAAAPSFKDYAAMLKDVCPELFSGKYVVLTEFGRRFNAKQGFIVSRVEYTKESGGRQFAAVHAGADLFVRTIWAPTKWAIRVSVLNSKGDLKQSKERISYDVSGPCCFAGDVIAHERSLPPIEAGDYIVAHDTGGYYFSSYCYYNVRQAPPIYSFEADAQKLKLVKKGQTVEETLAFFD
eukprot:TRINITY_DN7214_c0_g1_i2.p1 TRINITY_DN7214_c0_g1~~TRINITY_DN7214_c0_g1_i2.p1  ORF type:complete len:447 (-),score=110.25 TRINITY_DN7214_c0_g1_i2:57-1373(-)